MSNESGKGVVTKGDDLVVASLEEGVARISECGMLHCYVCSLIETSLAFPLPHALHCLYCSACDPTSRLGSVNSMLLRPGRAQCSAAGHSRPLAVAKHDRNQR